MANDDDEGFNSDELNGLYTNLIDLDADNLSLVCDSICFDPVVEMSPISMSQISMSPRDFLSQGHEAQLVTTTDMGLDNGICFDNDIFLNTEVVEPNRAAMSRDTSPQGHEQLVTTDMSCDDGFGLAADPVVEPNRAVRVNGYVDGFVPNHEASGLNTQVVDPNHTSKGLVLRERFFD